MKINGHEFNQEATTTLNGFKSSTSNLGSTDEKAEYSASKWDPFVDGENGVVEEAWGFKDASSDITGSLTASPLKEVLFFFIILIYIRKNGLCEPIIDKDYWRRTVPLAEITFVSNSSTGFNKQLGSIFSIKRTSS